jgi:5-oxoprolinase (ATP-hydrolysing) subunit C
MTSLVVTRAGPACSVQDAGRRGYLRFGVTPSGPMDWVAHATANSLAGNAPGLAGIEAGPGGIDLAAGVAPVRLGIAVRGFAVRLDGRDLPAFCAVTVPPGGRLILRAGDAGVWAYVAVAGGIDLPPVMGSRATHLRSGIGPVPGGALRDGVVLPCAAGAALPDMVLAEDAVPPAVIRFVPGPQVDAFSPEGFETFCTTPYTVTPRIDRMAWRLAGARIAHARGHDIVSDGIALGAIQVPGDGQPLILMADRQPTGGYPKIGTVIRADLPAVAQARPGAVLRFAPVGVEEAVAALRVVTARLAAVAERSRPLRGGIDLEALASGNHASGFVDPLGG